MAGQRLYRTARRLATGKGSDNGPAAHYPKPLMLRLILSFSLAAAAALPAAGEEPKAEASEAQPLRRVVALLDYVSGDYARAVGPSGELLSEAEHQEQIGFVKDAARELRTDAGAQGEHLAQKLDALAKKLADRAPPSHVAAQPNPRPAYVSH